jgi:hypothetical protein
MNINFLIVKIVLVIGLTTQLVYADSGRQPQNIVIAASSYTLPAGVMAGIKGKAKKDYPNDYSQQKYVIKKQRDAYRELRKFRASKVPPSVVNKIKQKAARDYPGDYSLQLYVVKKQVKDYREIN